ncbi:3-deoxy-D-manno-octulosonate 8-phosphate phosphatase KdsC [Ephemeroptericola cinctiostellae]|uniref:3-deoxy-D-manno-octulosonate 8-phosphate phosphatase KdsC n=1 Tax=Ephemeroptericola cinctiostellae TaxID=2268024 RepID=A0A345D8U1_9BURK|nr:HAD hydrolase family protein [Ephemeroptericola cinctiostellae]AXF84779.1 3-deoxy-D-manno-octulosonate 8-phosphate phosphatase KdsC [Ephemeroptericola cinctiostellae]
MTNALYSPTTMPSDFVIALARNVRLLILDVDGVLTTGYLDYDAQGEMVKSFYVQDGLGIQLLRQMGIPIAIISGRDSKVTAARAKDLKIDFLMQGAQDKGAALKQLMIDAQVTPQQCAYMGDDVIDLPILRAVGFASSVPNGHVLAQRAAHWVSSSSGGAGAVRELAELILFAQDKLNSAYAAYLYDEQHPNLDIM